jgi:hypothetical protein
MIAPNVTAGATIGMTIEGSSASERSVCSAFMPTKSGATLSPDSEIDGA